MQCRPGLWVTSLVPCGEVRKLGKLGMIAESGRDYSEKGGKPVNLASGACMSQASASTES